MLGTIRVCDLSINLWCNMIHVLVILLYASYSYKYSYHVVDMNKYIYIYSSLWANDRCEEENLASIEYLMNFQSKSLASLHRSLGHVYDDLDMMRTPTSTAQNQHKIAQSQSNIVVYQNQARFSWPPPCSNPVQFRTTPLHPRYGSPCISGTDPLCTHNRPPWLCGLEAPIIECLEQALTSHPRTDLRQSGAHYLPYMEVVEVGTPSVPK